MNQQVEVQFGYVSEQFFETEKKYKCGSVEKLLISKIHKILPKDQVSKTAMTF